MDKVLVIHSTVILSIDIVTPVILYWEDGAFGWVCVLAVILDNVNYRCRRYGLRFSWGKRI